MHRLPLAVLLSASLTMPAVVFAAPQSSVTIYEVTIQRTWSEAKHPPLLLYAGIGARYWPCREGASFVTT